MKTLLLSLMAILSTGVLAADLPFFCEGSLQEHSETTINLHFDHEKRLYIAVHNAGKTSQRIRYFSISTLDSPRLGWQLTGPIWAPASGQNLGHWSLHLIPRITRDHNADLVIFSTDGPDDTPQRRLDYQLNCHFGL